jgi:uncharacterized protein (TIGR01440 family)
MTSGSGSVRQQVRTCLEELVQAAELRPNQLLVIGTSTSEVLGKRIGTEGSMDAAREIYEAVQEVRRGRPFHVAFQCCEHLNRALVVERATAEAFRLDEVTVIPVAKAGGSMAAYAYQQMSEPCVVESIQAHAGIDIGETLIGMHLRPVAVPLRPSIRYIGEARVTMARTRPKLIGGSRAVYELQPKSEHSKLDNPSCS